MERERAAPLLTGAIVSDPYEFPSLKVQTPQVFNRCSLSLSLVFFFSISSVDITGKMCNFF